MINCIFTLDYEIFGDGTGSLKELVYEPAVQLIQVFRKWDARFVVFVEVAELEKIEARGTDPAVDLVLRQIREFDRQGFEVALHLHPQWVNAHYEHGRWVLDYTEYNLCVLPRPRIEQIVQSSLCYLRHAIGRTGFVPISFRAGNWLFQPTGIAAQVLADHGLRIDSSVFKGGVQHNHKLDYRPALKNGYFWRFSSNVNQPDPAGEWVEVPIYTELVPFWRMPTSKRMGYKNSVGGGLAPKAKLNRFRDFLRFRYPLKLDFCRMTFGELKSMIERLIRADQAAPESYKPIVAIGHTKDLSDLETVDAFLSFLRASGIPVSTFESIFSRVSPQQNLVAAGT